MGQSDLALLGFFQKAGLDDESTLAFSTLDSSCIGGQADLLKDLASFQRSAPCDLEVFGNRDGVSVTEDVA